MAGTSRIAEMVEIKTVTTTTTTITTTKTNRGFAQDLIHRLES